MEVVYLEPLYRLVKIAARSFYDDVTTEGDNQSKTGRSDKGIAVVVLDALARRQWVREEVLAKDLKLHPEQLRLILCFLGEEKLITREYREEIAEGAKLNNAAVAATVDVLPGSEADDEIKLHARSSCCLDYVQIYDVVRCRLHRMKKKLKKYELEDKNTRLDYVCPNCAKKWNVCPKSTTCRAPGVGDGRHFIIIIRRIFEVAFSGAEGKSEGVKSESGNPSMKVLPPWMIKDGMNLTGEQAGVGMTRHQPEDLQTPPQTTKICKYVK